MNLLEAYNVITYMCKIIRMDGYSDCEKKVSFRCGEIDVDIEGCCIPRDALQCIKDRVCNVLRNYSGKSYGLEHIYGPVTAVVGVRVQFDEYDFDVTIYLGDIGRRSFELFRYDKFYNVVYDYEYSFEFADHDISDSRLRETIISGIKSKKRWFAKFDEDCVDIFFALAEAIAEALIDCGNIMNMFRIYSLFELFP